LRPAGLALDRPLFLASAAADFMTGQTLYPDGGLIAIG
jgi:NAD(P)-dependent dehydrogenase (short-subunit alcohol dehydrogenase family)